ncbi:hypothetical protein FQA47_005187 [Oryzias melastigma]|uniref:Uncharacterized protein n=1 Tax=Oryzias melastigma TaxID=30732 RepID=A0A834F721_ORYME|nr:hypothetical protein FQA47_005187 [Oryzias melastigma]
MLPFDSLNTELLPGSSDLVRLIRGGNSRDSYHRIPGFHHPELLQGSCRSHRLQDHLEASPENPDEDEDSS